MKLSTKNDFWAFVDKLQLKKIRHKKQNYSESNEIEKKPLSTLQVKGREDLSGGNTIGLIAMQFQASYLQ